MMIPYIEIIRETEDGSLKTYSFIEPSECWFELSYQDVGEFELYCPATKKNLTALKKGYYVKIPNRKFGWVITSVQYEYKAEGGVRMVSAKGYELKWLLKKRIIQKPIQISKNFLSNIHNIVGQNMGEGASTSRKIPYFKTLTHRPPISGRTNIQVPRGNLLEVVNTLLKARSCGSTVFFEKGSGNTYEMHFKAYEGEEKQNSVRFSQSFDNLLSSTYFSSDADVATFALVVSEAEIKKTVNGEEVTQDIEVLKEVDKGRTGSMRSEILIESNVSTKYEESIGGEKELDLANATDLSTFQTWQEEEGKTTLSEHTANEEVSGEIDLKNSLYKFDEDFFLGDKVRVQDEYFDFYLDAVIAKVTIKQDASGYGEEVEYK